MSRSLCCLTASPLACSNVTKTLKQKSITQAGQSPNRQSVSGTRTSKVSMVTTSRGQFPVSNESGFENFWVQPKYGCCSSRVQSSWEKVGYETHGGLYVSLTTWRGMRYIARCGNNSLQVPQYWYIGYLIRIYCCLAKVGRRERLLFCFPMGSDRGHQRGALLAKSSKRADIVKRSHHIRASTGDGA